MAADEAMVMPSLVDSEALPLILAHPSILEAQSTIMRLMACSVTLQQAVHACCVGAVPVALHSCSSAAVSSFSSWAARHARVMRSLTVPATASFEDGSALVAALEAAACRADGGQLRLESLSISYLSAALLQRLCSKSLRRLSACAISDPAAAGPALAALSNLRSLRLTVAYPQLCPALLSLSCNLEELELCQLQDAQGDLECFLPHRLKHLTVPGSWHQPGSKLQLGHLTALTAISSSNSSGFSVWQGDVLPPALRHLDARGLASPEPLLPLRQLRSLSVRDCRCSAEQLAQLGRSLPALAGVTLSFWSTDRAANAAGGLSSLPVHSLWLGSCGGAPLQLATLECLGGLTGLTSLSLTCKVGASDCAQQLGRVLAQLTQLRELSVWKPDLAGGGSTAGEGRGGSLASLLGGVTGLPRLASLTLSGLRCSQPQELRQLGAAGAFGGGLTGLVLNDMPGLCDGCVEAALLGDGSDSDCGLGESLLALDLSRNAAVGDAALAVVAGCLQQLTQLQVLGTRVTDSGVAALSRLRHLRQLAVPERVRAAAKAQALAGCRDAKSGCGLDADG